MREWLCMGFSQQEQLFLEKSWRGFSPFRIISIITYGPGVHPSGPLYQVSHPSIARLGVGCQCSDWQGVHFCKSCLEIFTTCSICPEVMFRTTFSPVYVCHHTLVLLRQDLFPIQYLLLIFSAKFRGGEVYNPNGVKQGQTRA